MTELSLSNYSNIPTIPFDQIRDLLHDTEHNVSREDWTVLRFDNPFVDRPLEFIKQLDDLSKILKFRTKDSENYGEKYKAISIQKDYVKSQVKEADYDSVDANSFAQNLDAVNSKPLYFTPWGFTYDSDWFEKWDRNQVSESIDLISWVDRPDLKLIYEEKQKKHKSTSYLVLNDWAETFRPILGKFYDHNLLLYYGRYLLVDEKMISKTHIDSDIRIHIPIYTNDQCATEFFSPKTGESLGTFHMPADGSFYLFNGHIRHTFYNQGIKPRLHVVFLITSILRPRWRNLFTDFQDCMTKVRQANKLGK